MALLLGVLVVWGLQDFSRHVGGPRTDGPLEFAGGGAIVLPPGPRGQMTAVFGSMLPCTRDGVAVRITDIDVYSEPEGTRTEVAIRTIPGTGSREQPQASKWMPIIAAYRDFHDPRFQDQHAGEYLTEVAGAVVASRCSRRRNLAEPFVEWMTLVRAGPEGAKISGERITYEYDGDAYVTELDWTFIICGTLVREDDCPDLDPVPGP